MARRRLERDAEKLAEKSTPRSKFPFPAKGKILASQKQKLSEAKERMEQLYAARTKASVEAGPLTKEVLRSLFDCTGGEAGGPDSQAVDQLVLLATAGGEGAAEQMTEWLISRLDNESEAVQLHTLALILALLETKKSEGEAISSRHDALPFKMRCRAETAGAVSQWNRPWRSPGG